MRTPQFAALLLLATAVAACNDRHPVDPGSPTAAGPVPAMNVQPLPPIAIEDLTAGRHAFTDAVAVQVRNKPHGRPAAVANLQDASNIAVLRITVQPGARFPWHTHPGPVLVAVKQGTFVYVYADDCVERPYPAGTAFVDPGFENVHFGFNPTAGETVLIATFLNAPSAGPLTIPVAAAMATELDAKCGIVAAAAHAH
jgi:hypothetical protein